MSSIKDFDLKVRDLAELSEAELTTLGQLEISEWQEIKGGSFTESLEAWRKSSKKQVLGFSFLLADQLVGMTLFKRPPLSPSWASENAATIHGLKISTPWQRKGLGHNAMHLAVNRLKKEWPAVTTLMLAVDADNAAAMAVYRAFGMTDSGPVKGPNGLEHRFEISLSS